MENSRYSWFILNQSQSPAFQQMLEALSRAFGRGCLVTGKPFPVESDGLDIVTGCRYDKTGLLGRLKSWFGFTLFCFYKCLRIRKNAFFMVVTNPPFLVNLIWFFSLLKNFRYSLLIWDIYPDHLVQARIVRKGGLVDRFWTALNARAYLKADTVITISDNMAATIRQSIGAKASEADLRVIPNWVNTDVIRPVPKTENPFACQHAQDGKITVMYSGNIGHTHELDTLLEAAAQLKDHPLLSFLIIGEGMGKAAIRDYVEKHRLGNVILQPWQPWEVVPYSLATADIAIVAQSPNTEHLSMPSKTYSFLSAGCAIVALTSAESDLARVVTTHQAGVVVSQGDVRGLTSVLEELAVDKAGLFRYKKRAREAALAHYSTETVFLQFKAVLEPSVRGAAR